MQTLLKRWTHALLEWLGLTSATGDALDRWAAFVLVVLAAVVFDLLLQLGIVHGVRKLVERTRANGTTRFSAFRFSGACVIF